MSTKYLPYIWRSTKYPDSRWIFSWHSLAEYSVDIHWSIISNCFYPLPFSWSTTRNLPTKKCMIISSMNQIFQLKLEKPAAVRVRRAGQYPDDQSSPVLCAHLPATPAHLQHRGGGRPRHLPPRSRSPVLLPAPRPHQGLDGIKLSILVTDSKTLEVLKANFLKEGFIISTCKWNEVIVHHKLNI